jgi:hypothetical protein
VQLGLVALRGELEGDDWVVRHGIFLCVVSGLSVFHSEE